MFIFMCLKSFSIVLPCTVDNTQFKQLWGSLASKYEHVLYLLLFHLFKVERYTKINPDW